VVTDIKETIGVGRNSATPLENKANVILLPVGGLNNTNEALKSKSNTLEWAKSIQRSVNKKYNSKVFGNLINIDNNTNPRGTLVSLVIPSKLIDAFESKANPNYFQTENTVSKKNDKLEQDLKEFATINGIKIEFIDSLVEQFGGDYVAAYDAVNKIVYINEGKAGLDTLSEEVAHSLVEALGDEHFLVKKALNLLSKTDYKSTLDPEYIKLYKNNEVALKKEVLGKLIAQVLVKKYEPKSEPEFKLFGSIMQLIDKFISLFKRNDRLEDVTQQLSEIITNKEVVTFSDVEPNNQVYFQVDSKKKVTKIDDSTKKQYVYLKQELAREERIISKLDVESERYKVLKDKVTNTKSELEKLEATGNKSIIINLGNELLDGVELMLNDVEDITINKKLTNNDIAATETMLDKFSDFPALAERSQNLKQRLIPIIQQFIKDEITARKGETEVLEDNRVFGRDEDVSKLTGWFGKLSNSKNYIARTIGSMIKEVQSKVSAENKKVVDTIKDEVELLREYSKSNGISETNMYDIFIQKHKGTTVLTREYNEEFYEMLYKASKMDKTKAKEYRSTFASYNPELGKFIPKSTKYYNENYKTIQKTPALKRFYDFHKKVISEAASKLPANIDPNFIANISSNNLLDAFKVNEGSKSANLMQMASNLTGIDIKQFEDGTFVADEGLFQDLIPLKFIAGLDASKKSGNLGDNLATFYKFANSYEQMSEILPTIRTMQNQLGRQSFTKASNPNIAIGGEETNIYKFVDTVIDMQVKGNTKNDEGKIKIGTLYDDNGNPTGEKYIHTSKLADFGMKYNSLLRIGLNPINAVTNVLVGDFGNIIEGFGGRFYTLENLTSATNIFMKDSFNRESDLQKWRDAIGPLQELDDYETVEQVSTGKKLTKAKVEELMYMPQKLGENFLQNRTMIAILIKDGYMDSSGKTTDKGKNITDEQLKRLTNKVYEVNNKIHGRYSARDAAAISQNVLARMALQFKKWIPAAIESRFESKHFNIDLGVEVEGRYKTGWRLLKKALQGDLKVLQSGNMTELEIYNMRKNLAEIAIALGATLSFIAMGAFGDDDEELKKNPYYKFTMDQLDRVSGDLLFFYNPDSYTQTALKPIALVKTTSDVIMCITAFPHIFGLQGKKDIYQSGSRTGENKFLGKLADITPIIAPIAKVVRSYKDVKYQKMK
jgi:hypothetical protein